MNLNGGASEKVTFKNTILNVSVSLNANYSVASIEVERETADEAEATADYSELIEAYECSSEAPAVTVGGKTYYQGDEIAVCISDTSDGIVQVEDIEDLVVSQGESNSYNFVLGTMYNPDVTTLSCVDGAKEGRRVCYAKFRALARFFQQANPEALTITGSVNVVRDGRKVRRNLRMALPSPEEKTEEAEEATNLAVPGDRRDEAEEGSGKFEVVISLGSADDSAASGRFESVAAGLASMAVGAAGAALIV